MTVMTAVLSLRFGIILWALLGPCEALVACSAEALQSFIKTAQELAPSAAPSGEALVACPREGVEAAQWLAFYQAVRKSYPEFGPVIIPSPVPGLRAKAVSLAKAAAVDQVIAAAYAGDPSQLRLRLAAGDPSYSQNSRAHLALARMQMRAGEFTAGLRSYESALRLGGSQPQVELEFLYGFIWAGQISRAEREFQGLGLNGMPAYYIGGIERGRALIQKITNRSPATNAQDAETSTLKEPAYGLHAQLINQPQRWRLLSFGANYTQWLSAHWQHHRAEAPALQIAAAEADEFWLSKSYTPLPELDLSAEAGLFSFSKRLGYDLRARLFGPNLWGAVGLRRHSSFARIPLLGTDAPWRTEAYLEAGWGERLVAHTAYRRDELWSPFFAHGLEIRELIYRNNGEELRVQGLFEFEQRHRPSPDYESFARAWLLGAGLQGQKALTSRLSSSGELRYLWRRRLRFQAPQYQIVGGTEVVGKMAYELSKRSRVQGELAWQALAEDRVRTEVEPGLRILFSADFWR